MRSTVGLGVSGRGANTSSIAFSKKNGGANFVIIAKDRHHNHRMFGGDVFDVKLVPRTGKVCCQLFPTISNTHILFKLG